VLQDAGEIIGFKASKERLHAKILKIGNRIKGNENIRTVVYEEFPPRFFLHDRINN